MRVKWPVSIGTETAAPVFITILDATQSTSATMFRHRQQLRLWAARVLLAWVFAMGAGVANACLSTVTTEHAGLPAAHAAEASATHHGESGTPHGAPDQVNCADFCDKAGVSIPTLKPAVDDVQAYAVMCLVGATALPVPVLEPAQASVPRRDGVRAPPIPIPIAFLRLAL
jgi:hypothetical protein